MLDDADKLEDLSRFREIGWSPYTVIERGNTASGLMIDGVSVSSGGMGPPTTLRLSITTSEVS
jgi:hypothetical protein